jgi:hypothetical protein
VAAVGLTWRDLVSSVAILAIIITWWAYEVRVGPPLLSSAATTGVMELVLGACCAVAAAFDLHTTPQPRVGVIFRRITTVTGTIALVAGLIGTLGSSGQALEILVVSTAVLWTAGTIWHVLSIGAEP